MTALTLVCGATFGLGLFLLIRELVGVPVGDVAEVDESVKAPMPLVDRFPHLWWRVGGATVGAIAIGVLTAWPVGVVLAGVGGFFVPSLLGGKARREAAHAHLDAIATWTEQLRDVMAAASGLEQAIVTTAAHAPPPIRRVVPKRTLPAEFCRRAI